MAFFARIWVLRGFWLPNLIAQRYPDLKGEPGHWEGLEGIE